MTKPDGISQPSRVDETASSPAPIDPVPMGRLERAAASVVGLAASGFGVYAVFRSDNQAGTAVLLIAGIAFLLVGIQGTPLLRLRAGESGIDLERRYRARRVADEAKLEQNEDVAAGMMEAVSIIAPEIANSPEYRALAYESKVRLAFQRLGVELSSQERDVGYDFVAIPAGGMPVAVVVKYRQRARFTMHEVDDILRRLPEKLKVCLVVTNARLSPQVRGYNASEDPTVRQAGVVMWQDEGDDAALGRALLRVAPQ